MSNAGKILVGLALILGLAPAGGPEASGGSAGQSGCQGCARTAIVERAISDIPFYVERIELLRSGTQSRLVESLTTPCFHLLDPEAVGSAGLPVPQRFPEYIFLVDFSYARTVAGETAKAGATRLTLELLYNGEPRETVFQLATDSPIEDYSSQVNRMYQNRDAAINRVKPIDEVLRGFERRSVTCAIDLGSTGELMPSEEAEVKLTDFRDALGRPSKYFNRVVVEAERGRIKSGTPLASAPERRAFRIGDGTVTIAYEAPKNCAVSEDKIIVHSSCSILDPGKEPIEMTRVDQKISEKKIKIICPDLIVDYNTTIKFDRSDGPKGTFFSTVQTTYRLTSSVKTKGMIRERYKCLSTALLDFQGQAEYSRQWKTADCEGKCYGKTSPSGIRIHQGGVGLCIIYDEATGSVQKIELDSINVEVECLIPVQCREKCRFPPYDRSFQFSLSPFLERAIEVVSDLFKVQRVSGSCESGVISGSAGLSAGILGDWELQFSFRKNKG